MACSRASASGLSVIGCNTDLVKPEDRPKSFADLLDPKWKGKIVKAHPSYSGTIMTATYPDWRATSAGPISRSSRSRASCRCSRRPIRRRSSRSASAPCRPTATSTTCSSFKEAGRPVEPLYASEGTPLVVGPNGIFKNAPNPNAARLFQSYLLQRRNASSSSSTSAACARCTRRPRRRPGRKPFKDIKTMKEDAAGVEKNGEEIKARYSKLFKV